MEGLENIGISEILGNMADVMITVNKHRCILANALENQVYEGVYYVGAEIKINQIVKWKD